MIPILLKHHAKSLLRVLLYLHSWGSWISRWAAETQGTLLTQQQLQLLVISSGNMHSHKKCANI